MILRSIIFIGCAALAYALLRGWPEGLPALMRACAAVLALVAGLGLWAKRSPRGAEASARGRRVPHWLDYVAIGAAVLAVECGFLWLLGTAPRPLESFGMVIERYLRPEAAALRAVNAVTPESRSGNWLWTRDTRRPLPKRTDFKLGYKPEVFLRLQDRSDATTLLQGKVHVRAFALSRYERAAWSPLAERPWEITADDTGVVRIAPVRQGKVIAHEVFHSADSGGQNVFTALQGAVTGGISPLQRIDEGLLLLPPPNSNGGFQYQAGSQPMRIEDLPNAGFTAPWPGAADELLALPTSAYISRLRVIARSAAGGGSLKQQLLQLQNHLRGTLEYSLETHNSLDLDPIENFLFEEKRGHCEYFATAGALMARALGIPSRVAYGWAGGKWFEESGLFVFRANEAHAWTEVWLENHGWVIMDPTPQATGAGERAEVASPGEKLPDSTDPTEESETSAATNNDADFPRLALVLMVAFALPACIVALLRSRHVRHDEAATHHSPDALGGPTPSYLKAWRHACAARGMPMPAGFTLRRQISHFEETPGFAAELLDYHYATRYEGRESDERIEKQLTSSIRDWETEISGINHTPESSYQRS